MKITYYILITGAGQGCDYTIGCNKRWEKIVCDPSELKRLVRERLEDISTDRIEKVEAIAMSQYTNFSSILDEIKTDKDMEKKKEKDAKEKELLAQLLKKHGTPV